MGQPILWHAPKMASRDSRSNQPGRATANLSGEVVLGSPARKAPRPESWPPPLPPHRVPIPPPSRDRPPQGFSSAPPPRASSAPPPPVAQSAPPPAMVAPSRPPTVVSASSPPRLSSSPPRQAPAITHAPPSAFPSALPVLVGVPDAAVFRRGGRKRTVLLGLLSVAAFLALVALLRPDLFSSSQSSVIASTVSAQPSATGPSATPRPPGTGTSASVSAPASAPGGWMVGSSRPPEVSVWELPVAHPGPAAPPRTIFHVPAAPVPPRTLQGSGGRTE